jgi:poly-gamma-glutamate synthase PgsB/CapB
VKFSNLFLISVNSEVHDSHVIKLVAKDLIFSKKSDIGVITNTRLDHLDLMGPGIRNCTLSLSNTIPDGKKIYTSEYEMLPLMRKVADERKSEIVGCDGSTVSTEEVSNFSHMEHKDNISLALKICTDLGIDREVALSEMYKANPDIGAAGIYLYKQQKRSIYFANFFAANDPESTAYSINYAKSIYTSCDKTIVTLSTREDRMYRSEQLAEMMGSLDFDYIVLVGDEPKKVRDYLLKYKVSKEKIISLGSVTGEKFVNKCFEIEFNSALVIGIGNIHGNGSTLLQFFRERKVN